MSNAGTNHAEDSKLSSFVSHLIELRDRMLRMVIAVAVVFIVLAPFAKHVYAIFAMPLTDTGVQMISIAPAAPLLIPYKLTLMVAFLIALPYVFYQAWQFIAPGLYKHEKRIAVPMITSSVILFYMGVLFAYFVLLKMMFTVIPLFLPDAVNYTPDIGEYLDFVMMMFIAFGFCFEMPIATILLISTGVTTAEKLATKRPYVIVGAFVVGMVLTPPDVISQILLAIPMWLLFELGLFLSKFFDLRLKQATDARKKRNENAGDESPSESLESDSTERSPSSASAAGAVAATSVADQADALWSESDEKGHDYSDADEAQAYEAFENYHPRSNEELDAELDAIAEEEALDKKKEPEDKTSRDDDSQPTDKSANNDSDSSSTSGSSDTSGSDSSS
ncbi:twin-arginine translocase subunit TatC [Leucothrix arctica]|uniref:Sec-independent protein translocase protein TatC n=1 Tax=Leucothrix arctica TaxID=1481894 RepID=A0A317CHJ8_9GAMM|nr:twin-arginine translocase subunit TatC [Leucothrix arctica]PWQ95732.1 twin-arginine translocase subunit TatC [Leucothrix arctica]